MSVRAAGELVEMAQRETIEKCATWIESYTPGQIRMACGEMTAQEMRTVQAVQRWWVSAFKHFAAEGFEGFDRIIEREKRSIAEREKRRS